MKARRGATPYSASTEGCAPPGIGRNPVAAQLSSQIGRHADCPHRQTRALPSASISDNAEIVVSARDRANSTTSEAAWLTTYGPLTITVIRGEPVMIARVTASTDAWSARLASQADSSPSLTRGSGPLVVPDRDDRDVADAGQRQPQRCLDADT